MCFWYFRDTKVYLFRTYVKKQELGCAKTRLVWEGNGGKFIWGFPQIVACGFLWGYIAWRSIEGRKRVEEEELNSDQFWAKEGRVEKRWS